MAKRPSVKEMMHYAEHNMTNNSAEEFFRRRGIDDKLYEDTMIYEDHQGNEFLDNCIFRLAAKAIEEERAYVTDLDRNIIPDSKYVAITGTAWTRKR